MKKRILSFLLVAVMLIGVIPFSAMAAGTEATPTVADTTWYTANENADTYYLYDAADLLGFAKLGSEGKTFAGKTVVLMADIDLNPGWSADVTEDGTVVFPEAPANVWANITSFAGTLDGNGYTVSGLYKSMTVANSTGAYGGLFNTLAGGTVKNLKISNTFVLATNTSWGSGNIHVGGIAGDVAASSYIYNVVMDETVEVWYKSDEQACIGGAFGYSTGSFTVTGFVFVGVVGNTSTANAVNYSCPSNKTIYIATLLAATGGKTSTLLNATCLKTSVHTGRKNNTWNEVIGTWQDGMTAKQLATTRESADWLINVRPDDYGVSHYWSDTLQSITPKECYDIVEGTYTHAKADKTTSVFAPPETDANTYAVYTAEELLALLNNGGNFAGKTIMLMADINLNPGWSADVTENGTVAFPEAPATVWPEIASFAGTLDGNGYTLSGVYKTMTVNNSAGAYGGLFNTLAGGTVKNLKISNSFVLATNTGAGSGSVHVGGIAGDVNAGSNLSNVFMDETVEVWYKCKGQACIGGAFGYSNGSFTATGFVFVGVVGNTSLENAVNYSCEGTLYIATLLAATGGKASTLLNATCLKTSVHTGRKNNNWNEIIGTWQDGMTAKQLASTRESAEWLINVRPDDYGVSHYWSDTLQSITPKECYDIVEGTYEHIVITNPPELTPVIMYQTTEVVDGTYSIRFLAGINDLDVYNKVGFEITLIVGGNTYVLPVEMTTTTTVFTSIIADGKTVEAKDAGDGYNYLYACVIEDVTASDDIVINVSAVNVDSNDNVFTGSAVTFGFNNGNGNVIAK